jgi:hypothetical protein
MITCINCEQPDFDHIGPNMCCPVELDGDVVAHPTLRFNDGSRTEHSCSPAEFYLLDGKQNLSRERLHQEDTHDTSAPVGRELFIDHDPKTCPICQSSPIRDERDLHAELLMHQATLIVTTAALGSAIEALREANVQPANMGYLQQKLDRAVTVIEASQEVPA